MPINSEIHIKKQEQAIADAMRSCHDLIAHSAAIHNAGQKMLDQLTQDRIGVAKECAEAVEIFARELAQYATSLKTQTSKADMYDTLLDQIDRLNSKEGRA